ncbi:MAG: hypothetical protein NT007_08560 [Candidatus Kapabacteria bacterium]|nr:hypothetical protein [Candidatus Kapabacteria bacterium]
MINFNKFNKRKSLFFILISFALVYSCKDSGNNLQNPPHPSIDSVRFITSSYIELDKIEKISKFRSGIGHDYWDDYENCRSMKHYFFPFEKLDWAAVKIFAPVAGKVVKIVDEGRGMQIKIEPVNLSFYNVIIFHVKLSNPLKEGDSVRSGQLLGTHFSSETYSDIAIASSESNHYRLISYFNALPDSLFSKFQSKGAILRSDFIISKEERDADPLNCTGETFGTEGKLQNWVNLK